MEPTFFIRKRPLATFLLSCLLSLSTYCLCAQDRNQPAGSNIESAKNAVTAYESGDWDLLRANVHPDAVFYNLGSFDSLDLEETIAYWSKGREQATPHLSEEGIWLPVEDFKDQTNGNWVLHWGRNTLTYPSGEKISFPYHVAMKFEKGQVREAHFYYDNNRIIRALGYEIQPPLSEPEELEDTPEQQDF